MKKLTLSVLAVASVASFTACKKGAEDPGLTFRSRTARLAGEWTVSSSTEDKTTEKTLSNGVQTMIENSSVTGGTVTFKTDEKSTVSGSVASAYTLNGTATTVTYSIKKDGTWSSKSVIKFTAGIYVYAGVTSNTVINKLITTEENGTWQFTGKNSGIEEKKRESIILATVKSTSKDEDTDSSGKVDTQLSTNTYGRNEKVQVWHLLKLSNKEIKADGVYDSVDDGSYSNNGGTPTPNTKTVVKGKWSMTLKQ
jgi:hypothetical protein